MNQPGLPSVAARMDEIAPFHVMQLLARARELEEAGRHIIHMEVGEPDFATPENVTAAVSAALARGATKYTPALGIPALRQGIADYYRRRFGVGMELPRIAVTPGASGALQLALGVLLNPGDRVLLTDPGYPCNRNFVRLFEGEAIAVPVGPDTAFQLNVELLRTHWQPRTKAVLVATPSNPTGTLIDENQLRAMHAFCRERGAVLIVDEIYRDLCYDVAQFSASAIADDLFVVNSFSKFFGMTGWRVGWLVVPPKYQRAVDVLAQNLFLAPSTPGQYAALEAIGEQTEPELERRRETFRARRDFLLPALTRIGFRIAVQPEGAFYLYADCSAVSDNSFDFCQRLLEEAGVAATPGIDFGVHQAAQFVRFAYTTPVENLREGVARIEQFLAR